MIAVEALMDERPDFVLSGINHGQNMGEDVLYSGTVAAAMEGVSIGIPSIAISFAGGDLRTDVSLLKDQIDVLRKLLTKVLGLAPFPVDTLLNINLPPLRGEDIIGYISLGKGIVVHNRRCKNVSQLMINRDRIVDVEWAKSDQKEIHSVRLLALTENRTGMLAGITNAIAEIKTGIRDASANVSRDDKGFIEVTVEVFDKKHLDKVINSIEHVPGVISVERVNT